jgi:hypothetical protein
MRSRKLPKLTAFLMAGGAILGLAHPAMAGALLSRTPIVTIAISGVESQAQLADQLRAEGYENIVFSSFYPTIANPYPQQNPSEISDPAKTPLHDGWNGVAVKDGTTYQVYTNTHNT